MKFAVGQPVTRIEATRLITGEGNYTDDIKFEDMFDTWWLIKSITNHNITVTSFSLNTTTKFPNVILVEPDYVSIRYPSEEDLNMYKKYELGSTVTQADLMNKLAKAFGQKI